MHRIIALVALALALLVTGRAEASTKKHEPEARKQSAASRESARHEVKTWVLDAAGQWGLGRTDPS